VLARTPSFYRAHVPVPALVAHYTAVADASPGAGAPLQLRGVHRRQPDAGDDRRLATHPNIVGMKETSTDGAQFVDLAARRPAASASGRSAPARLRALCAGARARSSRSPACARALPRCFATSATGRTRGARIQQRLTPLARAVTTGFGIAGLKAAMDLCG
jgi:4-hydroxy-2-oxoglutarate aldolase